MGIFFVSTTHAYTTSPSTFHPLSQLFVTPGGEGESCLPSLQQRQAPCRTQRSRLLLRRRTLSNLPLLTEISILANPCHHEQHPNVRSLLLFRSLTACPLRSFMLPATRLSCDLWSSLRPHTVLLAHTSNSIPPHHSYTYTHLHPPSDIRLSCSLQLFRLHDTPRPFHL